MSEKSSISEYLFSKFPFHNAHYGSNDGHWAYVNRALITAEVVELTRSVVRAFDADEIYGSYSRTRIESNIVCFIFFGYDVPAA